LKQGIVLLAHGSRDPEWSRPFQRLAADLSRRLPAVAIALCFLEHGRSLSEGIAEVLTHGAATVRVVPVFLGQGGHVKEDLPRLVAAARRQFSQAEIRLEPPVGEQPAVIEAIAAFIASSTAPGSAAR
jgi:sirohydrochlorin cobaltochelatase